MDVEPVTCELGLPGGGEVGVGRLWLRSIAGRSFGRLLVCQTGEVGDLVQSRKSLTPILTLVFKPSFFLIL